MNGAVLVTEPPSLAVRVKIDGWLAYLSIPPAQVGRIYVTPRRAEVVYGEGVFTTYASDGEKILCIYDVRSSYRDGRWTITADDLRLVWPEPEPEYVI